MTNPTTQALESLDSALRELARERIRSSMLLEELKKARELAPDVMTALMRQGSRANLLLADRVHRADAAARQAIEKATRNG